MRGGQLQLLLVSAGSERLMEWHTGKWAEGIVETAQALRSLANKETEK